MSIKESTDAHSRDDHDRIQRLEEKGRTMASKLDDGKETMKTLNKDVKELTISVVKLQQRTDLLIGILVICTVGIAGLLFKPEVKQPIEVRIVMPDRATSSPSAYVKE